MVLLDFYAALTLTFLSDPQEFDSLTFCFAISWTFSLPVMQFTWKKEMKT